MRTTIIAPLGLIALPCRRLHQPQGASGSPAARLRPPPPRRPTVAVRRAVGQSPPRAPRAPRRPDPRQVHDRDRQPGLSAVLRRAARARQRPSRGRSGDPTNGKGFESAVAYAIAEQARVHQGRGRLGRRPVRQLVQAGSRRLRLRHQPGRRTARTGRSRRPVGGLLLRQPGGRRRSRTAPSRRPPT